MVLRRKQLPKTFMSKVKVMMAALATFIVYLGCVYMCVVSLWVDQVKQNNFPSGHAHTSDTQNVLVATMITDDAHLYTKGAVKLIGSIKRNLNDKTLFFGVLELEQKPLSEVVKFSLIEAGWKIMTVPRISPRDVDNTYPRFRDQFSKLNLWNMTQYERVLYLDSDTLCVGSIMPLLQIEISGKPLWAARDIRNSVWQEGFNMGVFMIQPNASEFKRLLILKDDKKFHFEVVMAEQGFLNAVYRDMWGDIGFVNNANLAAYVQDRKLWDSFDGQINVIHYTMEKPWNCGYEYASVCRLWSQFQV